MKQGLVVILLLMLAGVARAAAPDAHDAQVDAAIGDAVQRMRADIEAQRLGPDLDIATFLKQTGSCDQFVQTLRHADQIGGPRWVDDQTCQVKLAIESERVRQALIKIAADSGHNSPLPPEAIDAKLRIWDNRMFTATGTSISAGRADIIRPPAVPGPWQSVPVDVRRQTIAAARDNAIDHVIASLGPVEIADGKTVSQVLADANLRQALGDWIADRPVTRLEFRNDLTIEISIAADPHDVYEAFADIATKAGVMPTDSLKLAKIRQEFTEQTAPAVGSAHVAAEGNFTTARAPRMPRQAPPWIDHLFVSDATAKFKDSRLKTARIAENAARDALRDKVNSLQLGTGTIGDVAKHDAAVERAVQEAMDRAGTSKIEYFPDGSVAVKVFLDPRDLWDELRELP